MPFYTIAGMAAAYRKLLIKNIKLRMEGRFSSPEDLAKHCYWQSGKKKGKRVSNRQIRYLFEEGDDKPVPSADVIAAIAVALQCDLWELYFDPESMREKLIERLFPKPAAKGEVIIPKAAKLTSRV